MGGWPTEQAQANAGPLAGVRVLDLTRNLPGPYCTLLLANLGAEVTKVEDPWTGDPTRSMPPYRDGVGAKHLGLNRNKRSLAIDLKRRQGREVLYRLAERSDVFLEGFRPGVARRLGFDHETLSALNPGLVYCSISGYGQDGPLGQAGGHDLNYVATAGLLSLAGKPSVPGVQVADLGGGALLAAVGILAALRHRDRTGEGQYVDISMTDGALSWLSLFAADYLLAGEGPQESPITGRYACYNLYRAKDGRYLSVGALEPHFWQEFCRLIGREDLAVEQFAGPPRRERIVAAVGEAIERRTAAEWLELAAGRDACVALVNTLEEALSHPQIVHRGMVAETQGPRGEGVRHLACPVKLSRTPAAPPGRAPGLGEHTRAVLRELGYSDAKIENLAAEGVARLG